MILLFLKTLTRTREDDEAESDTRQVRSWERSWGSLMENQGQVRAGEPAGGRDEADPSESNTRLIYKIIFKTISMLFSSDRGHSWTLLLLVK